LNNAGPLIFLAGGERQFAATGPHKLRWQRGDGFIMMGMIQAKVRNLEERN
jgi:hypothetical protein